MRLFYNTNGFAHHRLEDAVRILADLGYDGVSITPDVHHLDPMRATASDVERLAALLDRLGLDVAVESGARYVLDPLRKHEPSLLSADGYERRRRFYERLLAIARDLGAPLVSIWSGRPPAGVDREAGTRVLARRLEPLLDRAERVGVRLAFEPEPGMLVETLADYARLKERLDTRLGLTIDVGHLVVNEEPPPERHLVAWRRDLLNVHLDDALPGRHEHLMFGEGALDLRAIVSALDRIGFEGPCSVELSRHSHDAVEAARGARDAIRAAGG